MKIHVCPLCGEPADYSDDYGHTTLCTHEPYPPIEPVEVEGRVEDGELRFALPDPEEWKRTTGAEMLAKKAERERQRAEWLALSCDERAAIREKQRAASKSPFLTDALARELFASMYAGIGGGPTITVPCPRCGDAECENAATRPNPHYLNSRFYGGYHAVVE